MARKKRKLTAAEKREKRRRRQEYMTIFVGGKMKRVRRPPTIEGLSVDEFILRNADPIWLHQNGLWEYMPDFGSPASADPGDFGDDQWCEKGGRRFSGAGDDSTAS